MRADESYVELRVHGVSGTPPEDLLDTTEVDDVAGDSSVRFVRPTSAEARRLPDEGVLEGMSWGGLTSGVATHAAWLVMLPFALVNAAFWSSRRLATDDGRGRVRAWLFRVCVRLLGLTLTVIITLAVALLAVDLLAWQCGGDTCAVVSERLAWFAGLGTGPRVALAAVVPVVFLGAVAWLSHRVSLRYEAPSSADMGGPHSGDAAPVRDVVRRPMPRVAQPDLFSPLMWHSEPLVQRLRGAHLAVGWASVALLLVGAADRIPGAPARVGAGSALWWPAALLAVAVLAVGTVLAVVPTPWSSWTARRLRLQGPVTALLQTAALAAVVLASLALLARLGADPGRLVATGPLPGLGKLLTVVVLVQVVALLLLMGVLFSWRRIVEACRRALSPAPAPPPSPDGAERPRRRWLRHPLQEWRARRFRPKGAQDPESARLSALGGLAPWVIAASGVLLGYVYSAAAVLRVADVLEAPAEGQDEGAELTVPVVLHWASAGFAVVVALVVVVAVVAGVLVSRRSASDVLAVVATYVPEAGVSATDTEHNRAVVDEYGDDFRIRRIVRARRLQRLVQSRRIVNLLAAGGVAGTVIAALAVATDLQVVGPLLTRAGWMAASLSGVAVDLGLDGANARPPLRAAIERGEQLSAAGSWILLLLAAGVVALLLAGWRSAAVRRRIGVAWDVLSFWPRGGHPFAPPSYCERAVPQMVARVRHLTRDPGSEPGAVVVIAAHSQGSVLAAAVVAQLRTLDDPAEWEAAGMPAPRCDGSLRRVSLLSHGSPVGRLYEPLFPQWFGETQLHRIDDALDGRWENLWRDTDPIGASLAHVLGERDIRCTDPSGHLLEERSAAYPPIRGHVDYEKGGEYEPARHRLVEAAVDFAAAHPAPAAPPPPRGPSGAGRRPRPPTDAPTGTPLGPDPAASAVAAPAVAAPAVAAPAGATPAAAAVPTPPAASAAQAGSTPAVAAAAPMTRRQRRAADGVPTGGPTRP